MRAKQVRGAILAGAFISALIAGSAGASTTNVRIVRGAGTCPASIALRTASVQYEGGGTIDITAVTMAVATLSELVSATRKRIEFRADLKPAYASCAGSGRDGGGVTFTLRGGKLSFVISNGISSGQYPGILELDVKGGNPHVSMGVAD